MNKILVTAATGHLGGAVLEFLKNRVPAESIVALARDEAKATNIKAKGITVRIGDYEDKASLTRAFEGIDTLLFISSGTLHGRLEQHINVVEAAKATGVKHIIYTSVTRASPDTKFTAGIDHYHTEEALKASGIPYTFFRNTYYTEVIAMLLGDALTTGQWYYAAGNTPANFAARADMAEALANVLAAPQSHINKTYEITGSKAHTFHDIAAIITNTVGKTITYTPIPTEALRDGLIKIGLPPQYVPVMTGMAEALQSGEFNLTDPALETLLNRKPTDLAEYLPTILNTNK